MGIKPIGTQADYRAALKAVESLMTAMARTPEGDRLDVLVTLIEAYEQKHLPMDAGMNLPCELEREEDGQWIAEVVELPGVLAYGTTANLAKIKARELALRGLSELKSPRNAKIPRN